MIASVFWIRGLMCAYTIRVKLVGKRVSSGRVGRKEKVVSNYPARGFTIKVSREIAPWQRSGNTRKKKKAGRSLEDELVGRGDI